MLEDKIGAFPTRIIQLPRPERAAGRSASREDRTMAEPTQLQLAHIHAERDAFVARWLKERPSTDLREALTAAFSAGATSALIHTGP